MHVLAAEGGYQVFKLGSTEWALLIGSVLTALLALAVGFYLVRGVLAADQGTPTMIEIASAIQEGAMAYLRRQFKTIAVILIPLAIVVFVTSTEVVKPLLNDGARTVLRFGRQGASNAAEPTADRQLTSKEIQTRCMSSRPKAATRSSSSAAPSGRSSSARC